MKNINEAMISLQKCKKLNEDQYENNRRKGAPSIKKIAKQVIDDDYDWASKIKDKYVNVADFVSQEASNLGYEYNIKTMDKARVLAAEVYRLATEIKDDE